MSDSKSMDPRNPKVNSEADARAWFEALIAEEGGTAQIPNPDDVREARGGCFAHEVSEGVKAIRDSGLTRSAPDHGVALIQDAARMNDAMHRVWDVVDDPHALAIEVEGRRPVRDATRPLLRTPWDVEAWLRELARRGVRGLDAADFEAAGFDQDEVVRLVAAAGAAEAGFEDPLATLDRVLEEMGVTQRGVLVDVSGERPVAREVTA